MSEDYTVKTSIDLDSLCRTKIESIDTLPMKRGTNVLLTEWNTNTQQQAIESQSKLIKLVKLIITLLGEFECRLNEDLSITLTRNTFAYTINFGMVPLDTKFISDKIEQLRCDFEDEINCSVDHISTELQLPLYAIVIDTQCPEEGQLHKLGELYEPDELDLANKVNLFKKMSDVLDVVSTILTFIDYRVEAEEKKAVGDAKTASN